VEGAGRRRESRNYNWDFSTSGGGCGPKSGIGDQGLEIREQRSENQDERDSGLRSFSLQGPLHDVSDGFFGGFACVENGIHLFGDGKFKVVLLR
jgi:hypothetical protein